MGWISMRTGRLVEEIASFNLRLLSNCLLRVKQIADDLSRTVLSHRKEWVNWRERRDGIKKRKKGGKKLCFDWDDASFDRLYVINVAKAVPSCSFLVHPQLLHETMQIWGPSLESAKRY